MSTIFAVSDARILHTEAFTDSDVDPYDDPTPPSYYPDYLNLPEVQQALGVTLNYSSNNGIYYQFQNTGDFIYPNFRLDLEHLLDQDVRVSLAYGDADYICESMRISHITLSSY